MTRSIAVTASIDLSDVHTEDLAAELKERGEAGQLHMANLVLESLAEQVADLRRAVAESRKDDALALIDRIVLPRFQEEKFA